MSLEPGKAIGVESIMGVRGGRPEQASGEERHIYRGREWDETKRQEEESLTRQRSQEGLRLGHLMGKEEQCGWRE